MTLQLRLLTRFGSDKKKPLCAVLRRRVLAATLLLVSMAWLPLIPPASAAAPNGAVVYLAASQDAQKKPSTANKHAKAGDSDSGAKASDKEANGHAGEKEEAGDQKKPARDTQTLPQGNAKLGQLLRLWSVFGSDVHSGCKDFNVGNLRCLTGYTDFSGLETYDRPALLTLKRKGHLQTVLLSAINDDGTVTLAGSDNARNVSRDRVKQVWTGQYTMIWRSESGERMILPGSSGKAVVWLRQRLLRAKGEDKDKDKDKDKNADDDGNAWLGDLYDPKLIRQLKAFQKAHGLKPDGIAGPRTQIILNDLAPAPGTPDLKPKKSSSESSSSSSKEEKDDKN